MHLEDRSQVPRTVDQFAAHLSRGLKAREQLADGDALLLVSEDQGLQRSNQLLRQVGIHGTFFLQSPDVTETTHSVHDALQDDVLVRHDKRVTALE